MFLLLLGTIFTEDGCHNTKVKKHLSFDWSQIQINSNTSYRKTIYFNN